MVWYTDKIKIKIEGKMKVPKNNKERKKYEEKNESRKTYIYLMPFPII